ncbi:trophozoite stage antigen [Plasmodium sp. gorilla clade G3]|nr:trophozoite stage antigen [Plasmodium sp. gorilla clade G3]
MGYDQGGLTKLYKSLYIKEKGGYGKNDKKAKRFSLRTQVSSHSAYDLKYNSVDTTMNDYEFEVFTTLNDKIRLPSQPKKINNKDMNIPTELTHEHNKFYATITLKCKDCSEEFTRDFEF